MQKHVPTALLCLIAIACGCTAPCVQGAATIEKVWLSDLDVSKTQQGWGQPHRNTSVDGNQMRIAGRQFEHGLGTHADSALYIQLDGRGRKLTGWVGIDDEVRRTREASSSRFWPTARTSTRAASSKAGTAPSNWT